jgi:hypothetical protein
LLAQSQLLINGNATYLENWLNKHCRKPHPEGRIEEWPIDKDERRCLFKPDFATLAPQHKSPLRKLLELSGHFRFSGVWGKSSPASLRPKHADKHLYITDDERASSWCEGHLLYPHRHGHRVGPLWILAYAEEPIHKLVVITVFIVVFLCLLSFGTTARPHEAQAATAG